MCILVALQIVATAVRSNSSTGYTRGSQSVHASAPGHTGVPRYTRISKFLNQQHLRGSICIGLVKIGHQNKII